MTEEMDCRYSIEHLWVRCHGTDVEIGVTNFGQRQMIRVNGVELPQVGKELNRGEILCVLHAMKAAVELPSPVSGTVTEVNRQLLERPWRVNSDPYGSGWLVRMRMRNPAELDDLLDEDTYNAKFPWSEWQSRLLSKYRPPSN